MMELAWKICPFRIRSAFHDLSGKEHDNLTSLGSIFLVFPRCVDLIPLRATAAVLLPPYVHMHSSLVFRCSSTVFDSTHMSQHNSSSGGHKGSSHNTEPTS